VLNIDQVSEPAAATAPCNHAGLDEIDAINARFEKRYKRLLLTDQTLTRGLVSFQASKFRSVYRWYKFKEAFSAGLVENLLYRYGIQNGVLLDPFAGSGTSLFASSAMGITAEGVELLPIGQRIIETKQLIDSGLSPEEIQVLTKWSNDAPWMASQSATPIPELKITKAAYPEETAEAIGKFLMSMEGESDRVRSILQFALLCVLESVSYTRKDGQYLRWDHRSGRRQGKKIFDKGFIPQFNHAIQSKLKEIVSDITEPVAQGDLFSTGAAAGKIHLHRGSSLEILPRLEKSSFDCIVTSPPYCNRYDYTRTYALELALLGVNEARLRDFRQQMLSCTVENRAKDLLRMNPEWSPAIAAADRQEILQSVLKYLEQQKDSGLLNNSGIPRMVRGYFYEMACVILECFRLLRHGAPLMMVNDNVRYAGASIPVDVILSELANDIGFTIEEILVLPNGKGNSSQQMGTHGREPLRKCVYIWRKA
jgi:DNA modification methylase